MRLLEYEAKAILHQAGLAVPASHVIRPNEPLSNLDLPIVLKSQVPIGGRGKLGGIQIIEDASNVDDAARQLFSLNIKGYIPKTLLAEEKIAIKNEHYVALLIDRATATIRLVAHKNGGIEVEDNHSDDFFNVPIDAENVADVAKQLASYLTYNSSLVTPFIASLYTAFTENDATLLEINPLILTKDQQLVCGDCKMELDDAARFRHPDWQFEEQVSNANFVTLNASGTVATIANGAGLAMATVDAVAAAGMEPANFLDIGGGANTDSVLAAFRQIMTFPEVTAIVINIFAGITRCDEVAKAIIAAKRQIDTLPSLYIRLAGTNFEEAVALLSAESITTLSTLEACIIAAKESTNE